VRSLQIDNSKENEKSQGPDFICALAFRLQKTSDGRAQFGKLAAFIDAPERFDIEAVVAMSQTIAEVRDLPLRNARLPVLQFRRNMPRSLADNLEKALIRRFGKPVILDEVGRFPAEQQLDIRDGGEDVADSILDRRLH
jgi:hypothetical protein